MQIILLQDVDKLGLRGEVVDVARGYARNYLLPRRLAETATPAKVKELEKREAQRARHEARTSEQAREVAAALEGTELRFDVKAGPTGVLFGSVTPTDIADGLWTTAKVRVDRRKIDLPESLKRVGRYSLPVTVFEDVVAEVRVLVVPEDGGLEALDAMEAAHAAEQEAAAAAQAEAEAAHAEAEAQVEEVLLAEDEAADEGDGPAAEEAGDPQAAAGPELDHDAGPEPGAGEPDGLEPADTAEPAGDERA